MHAIYQHRTDNEVPGRLPVAVDNDAAKLGLTEDSESAAGPLSGIPAADGAR